MLFNSYIFTLLFLPITVLVFYYIGGIGRHRIAIAWLVTTSLYFYAWWNPAYLGLMLMSILINYSLGIALGRRSDTTQLPRSIVLAFGITLNLCALGYFKYANFFVDNVNSLFGSHWQLDTIILPLAISFFTFQQIAYLVDAYRGETREYSFLSYCLFVTFFPQLIAGPIVHHKEMLPQFSRNSLYRIDFRLLAIGITIFLAGLFKKVVFADNVAGFASPIFTAAEAGETLTFIEAWFGALAYTAQLYFDFSGYSDMAIGLGFILGIKLPINFNSPYKAINIIDFWRRWHITLSRFLRDYLYFPLGGNRRGTVRRYINLMLTMLLGGLWHGAGWTFVAWGTLHGLYLVVNHAWHVAKRTVGWDQQSRSRWWTRTLAWMTTFLAVVVAWVFFRATSFQGALNMLKGMTGQNGIAMPAEIFDTFGWKLRLLLERLGWEFHYGMDFISGQNQTLWIAGTLCIALLMPNTQEIMAGAINSRRDAKSSRSTQARTLFSWRPSLTWGIITACIGITCLLQMSEVSEFLYFQF